MENDIQSKTKDLRGIGGWLLLYVIVCIIDLPVNVIMILNLLVKYRISELINSYTFWTTVIYIVTLSIYLRYFFTKRRYVPKLTIYFQVFLMLMAVVDIMVGGFSSAAITNIIVNTFWIIYFLKSVRVKNTFNK